MIQPAACLLDSGHTLDGSSRFPKDGDSQAPVHSLNQGGPLKLIVVLSEFLNFWIWWARSTLVPWKWRDFRKRTWVLSFLLCGSVTISFPSWIPIRIAGSILSPETQIPALYRLPLCYALQVGLLYSSSNCWPPSICQMQQKVEPALNLWKIMPFFFPSGSQLHLLIPKVSKNQTLFSDSCRINYLKPLFSGLGTYHTHCDWVISTSWRKTSSQQSYPAKTPNMLSLCEDRIQWEEGEVTTR